MTPDPRLRQDLVNLQGLPPELVLQPNWQELRSPMRAQLGWVAFLQQTFRLLALQKLGEQGLGLWAVKPQVLRVLLSELKH